MAPHAKDVGAFGTSSQGTAGETSSQRLPAAASKRSVSSSFTLGSDMGEPLDRHLSELYRAAEEENRRTVPGGRSASPEPAAPAAASAEGRRPEESEEKVGEYMEYLCSVQLLAGLPREELATTARFMQENLFCMGDTIVQQGAVVDTCYVLCEGSLHFLQDGVAVRTCTASKESGTASLFCHEALMSDELQPETVAVASAAAKVLALDHDSFSLLLECFLAGADEGEEPGAAEASGDPTASRMRALQSDPLLHLLQTEAGTNTVQSTHSRRIDDKLFALGMSQEQMDRRRENRHHGATRQAQLERLPKSRRYAYHVVHHRNFKIATLAFIFMNCICLERKAASPLGTAPLAEGLSFVFTALFAMEVFLRCYGCVKGRLSGWLAWDIALLAVAAVELACRLQPAQRARRVASVLSACQALRLLRFLRVLRANVRPLKVVIHALAGGWSHVVSAGIFISLIWLTASICCTAALRDLESGDERERVAQEYFSSVGRSMLAALETTVGGLCWGGVILDPLLASSSWRLKLGGVSVLLLSILSTFLIWNLVLGIYIRQVSAIHRHLETVEEKEALHDGHASVKSLRAMLESAAEAHDGHISRDELRRILQENEQLMEMLRMDSADIDHLYSAVDADGKGFATIGDVLFGILKITGATKTLDMLSIDYRQKVLLRTMTLFKTTTHSQLDQLTAHLDTLCSSTTRLSKEIKALHMSVARAKGDLSAEIERVGAGVERSRWQAAQKQQVLEARRRQDILGARLEIEENLASMRDDVEHLSQAREFSSAMASFGPSETAALRRAVRERLDSELGPWLESELANAGLAR